MRSVAPARRMAINAARPVVVVVHERALRLAAVGTLRQAGYTVLSSSTGKRGLRVVSRLPSPPACVLLDSAIQNPNGHDWLAQLPAWPGAPAVPVVVIAPDSFVTTDARVVRILRKPLDRNTLPVFVAAAMMASDAGDRMTAGPRRHDADARASTQEGGARERAEILVTMGQGLCPVPDGLARTILLLRQSHPSLREIVAVLKSDAPLAAGVLRLANSPLRARRRRVHTLAEAAVALGLDDLRRYLFTQEAACSLRQALPAYGLGEGVLLTHSLWTAALARLIVTHVGLPDMAGQAYASGLLHDAGKVVLNGLWPERNAARGTAAPENERAARDIAAERAALGVDHALVGSVLAHRWGVDAPAVALIAAHHDVPPDDGSADPVMLALCLANYLAPPRRDAPAARFIHALRLEDHIEPLMRQADAAIGALAISV